MKTTKVENGTICIFLLMLLLSMAMGFTELQAYAQTRDEGQPAAFSNEREFANYRSAGVAFQGTKRAGH